MQEAMDLSLIRTFLTVHERGGFKQAAERLNCTSAAVSQQIKRLEEVLGTRLLERSNQGIGLTSAGAILKPQAERLMALNHEMFGSFRHDEMSGPILFGSPTDYAPQLLSKLLPVFQTEFPMVSARLHLEDSRSLRGRIRSGYLDLAIVAREPDSDEGIALWSEKVGWYRARGSGTDPVRVGLLTTDCVLRDIASRDIAAHFGAVEPVLNSSTVAALCDSVSAGFCQALLPVSMAEGLTSVVPDLSYDLSFALIAKSGFDGDLVRRAAERLRVAL